MTHEEIIKTWFAIAQANDIIHTSLYSSLFSGKKMYMAQIEVGSITHFVYGSSDIYEAMASVIEDYSKWVEQNESK